ncbi:MAG: tetratricopeptide repeat protein [Bdellovibrionota bacterium]|nr:MAG: tetratricopeptide repeat protein [Bdellovibrionota bacterium]
MSFREKIANILFGPPERRAQQSYERGLHSLSKGRLDAAEFYLRSAAMLQPQSGQYLVGYGNALFANQKFESAVEQYSKAAAYLTPNAVLLSNWGVALRILGRINEALEKHEAAASLAPDDSTTLTNAAATLSQAGRTDRAISMLERAIKLDPENDAARKSLEALSKGP